MTCPPHTAIEVRQSVRCYQERPSAMTYQSANRKGADFGQLQPKYEGLQVRRFPRRLLEGYFRIICDPVIVVYDKREFGVHAKGVSELASVEVEATYSSSLKAHERPTSTEPSRSNPTIAHKTRFHSSSLGFGSFSYIFFRWIPTS